MVTACPQRFLMGTLWNQRLHALGVHQIKRVFWAIESKTWNVRQKVFFLPSHLLNIELHARQSRSQVELEKGQTSNINRVNE